MQLPWVDNLFIAFPISPTISTPPQHSSSQPEVNRSLLEILKMALRTTNGRLNIDNLNLSFRKEDRSFSGCLPPPKVTKIQFQICSPVKATSGHWVYSNKAQGWSVFCLWITLHNCLFSLPEKWKTRQKRNCEMYRNCEIDPGITYIGLFYVNNREYDNTQIIFHNGKQLFLQGQMFISHTLSWLPMRTACGVPTLSKTKF